MSRLLMFLPLLCCDFSTAQTYQSELFVYWLDENGDRLPPTANHVIRMSPLPDITPYGKYLTPLPISLRFPQVESELYLNACYQGSGTYGEIYDSTTSNGVVFYGKYEIQFIEVVNGQFEIIENLTRYIDFRDDQYGQSLDGSGPNGGLDGYANQDFFIVCHYTDDAPSNWSVSMSNADVDDGSTPSYASYGIWELATKLPSASQGQHTAFFNNFKLTLDLDFDLPYQVKLNDATYTLYQYEQDFIDSAFGFLPGVVTVTLPNFLTSIKCGTFPLYFSRWTDGILLDSERTFATGDKYVGIGAIYKRTWHRNHTIIGPSDFDHKMNVSFTSDYPRQPGGSYYCEWWIKYDFNQTWQNLGNGNQTLNIMTTASWGYSFEIKCFLKDYCDTIGVWSNELRCQFIGSQCSPCNPLEKITGLDYSDRTSTRSEPQSESIRSWYPVQPSRLSRMQKKAILKPMIETLTLINHHFRWRETDAFEAGNDSLWVLEDDENSPKALENVERDIAELGNNVPQNDQNPSGQLILKPNHPNPFNPSTTISFETRSDGYVRLTIYNTLGQRVRKLLDGGRNKGKHNVVWDGRNDKGTVVPTGIYFARLESNGWISTGKMMFIK